MLGFSGYQPLLRAYARQGMRKDLQRLEKDRVAALIDSLRRQGVSDDVLVKAVEEAGGDGR